MKSKPSRSRGVRNPVRNTVLFGLSTVAAVALILLGMSDMRETGRSGSPLLALGLFPALLCPIFFIYYATRIGVFRDMQRGRSAIARWTVPKDQFKRFCEDDRRIPASSVLTNFYKPPETIPAEGVEVIFSDHGVLIDGGYFPLSVIGGRRLRSVRTIASDPPSLEFAMTLTTRVRTSSATTQSVRTPVTLRVPVATEATGQAGEVARRYQAMIDQAE
jgi:hypothetical protein